MDEHLTSAVSRAFEKEEDLPDSAVDTDDDESNEMDIEHEQIYYLLTDAYPDQFDDPEDARDQIHEALGVEEEKGVDDEEDREETSEDFNPGNTPDNLDQHPYDEEEWQEDYDAEYGEEKEKECDHTDRRGRPLDEEECPWCEGGDEV
jgi:hypothetical protein